MENNSEFHDGVLTTEHKRQSGSFAVGWKTSLAWLLAAQPCLQEIVEGVKVSVEFLKR